MSNTRKLDPALCARVIELRDKSVSSIHNITGMSYSNVYWTLKRAGYKPVVGYKAKREVIEKKRIVMMQEEKKVAFVRPEAVYTNTPSPYGIASELQKQSYGY